MPPSQLKQLKASLREHGILGPQKSKKQKKANSKDAQKRLQRHAALEGIRERFNPFEIKGPARQDKFEVASNRPANTSIARPGVTRGLGEERRRDTLLKEIQSRNKVGGLLDRRFGENDPTMTPEQKAAERFARLNDRRMKKNSMFNLENDSEEEMALTHGGRSLDLSGHPKDDFEEDDLGQVEDDEDGQDFEAQDDRPHKRLRLEDDDERTEDEQSMPQRKKSKNEVMKEIIAKSKMYKAERQAAKADDDDLRAELDKGMSEFYEALRGQKAPDPTLPSPSRTDAEPPMNPLRAAILAGKSREVAEKEYEANLRQLKLDARSKPSTRTKTEEEKAAEEAARLEELERKRIRRMTGDAESSEDELGGDEEDMEEDDDDDAQAFGLNLPQTEPRPQLDVEDEDEFVLDESLIASDSEAEMATDQGSDDSDMEQPGHIDDDDGDDDFINGLVLPAKPADAKQRDKSAANSSLAYTFPCPQTHEELLDVVKDTNITDLPIVVQRIRALHHKGLAEDNQAKLDGFASVLTEHLAYLADDTKDVPFSVLESLIRHLHSMAKSQPESVGAAFRAHLRTVADDRPLHLTPGDMVILTAISTIFPTSDHFHSVVTPAMLSIGRYLGQSSVQTLRDLGLGAYCCSLTLQYQKLSKRYVPEFTTYIVNAFAILAPTPLPERPESGQPLNVPLRMPENSLRISRVSSKEVPPTLSFRELMRSEESHDHGFALSLLHTFIQLSRHAAGLWQSKSAFPELIAPFIHSLHHISTSSHGQLPSSTISLMTSTLSLLTSLQSSAVATRTPLLLHNHRPLAIKSSLPAFIENYNPDRHYDPDRARAELSRLRAEHKRERKGAMRELRKDANFIAREQLREKKEKDAAYEMKFKRLVAEIQGEEGREAKEYEREKQRRKSRF